MFQFVCLLLLVFFQFLWGGGGGGGGTKGLVYLCDSVEGVNLPHPAKRRNLFQVKQDKVINALNVSNDTASGQVENPLPTKLQHTA